MHGCERFDSGRNTLDNAAGILNDQKDCLLQVFIDAILSSRFNKDTEKRIKVESVLNDLSRIDLSDVAQRILLPLAKSASLLAQNTRIFSIDQLFGGVGPNWYNKDAYEPATLTKLRAELKQVGGISGLVSAAYPMSLDSAGTNLPKHSWMKEQVLSIVNTEFRKGQTLDGVPYELSDAELQQIRTFLTGLADEFEGVYLTSVLRAVFPRVLLKEPKNAGGGSINLETIFGDKKDEFIYRDGIVESGLATELEPLIRHVVLDSEETLSVDVSGVSVALPKGRFSAAARLAALSGLSSETFGINGWMKATRVHLKDAVTRRLQTLLGNEASSAAMFKDQIKSRELTKPIREWASTEVRLLEALEKLGE